ncbi:Polysaccharide biosynthesis protein [Chitinispirillum alkaliphilum]|nr:Polysaccharide biosynthesis protein [Chitinispirillum alkaliphilum]
MTEKNSKIITHNTKWLYISKFSCQIVGLFATILVIRKLPVEIFGTYNLLLGSVLLMEVITISAVSNVFNRYIPELVTKKQYAVYKKLIICGFMYSTILSTVLAAMLYLNRGLFASFFNIPEFNNYLVSFLIYCNLNFLKKLIETCLKSLLLHKKVAITTIISSIIRTTAYIVFIDKLDVVMLLYIEACISGLFAINGLIIYIRHNKGLYLAEISTKGNDVHSKRMIRYGALSAINELGVGVVGKTSDYFIIAAFSNPYYVGLYAFAHKLYKMIFKILPYKDFQTIIRPVFFKKYANKYDIDSFRNMYAFIVKMLLPVYALPAIYFFFFGRHIINIAFDPKYLNAYWVAVVVLSSNIFLAFFYPLGLTVMLKEKMEYNLYSKIIVVFSAFAGIYGMKYFGVVGVAIASLIGSFLKHSIVLFFMRGYPEVKYRLKDYRNFFIILPFLIPFLGVHYISLNVFTLIITTVSFFVYAIAVFAIFHPYNEYDQQILRSLALNIPLAMTAKRALYPSIQRVRAKIAVE